MGRRQGFASCDPCVKGEAGWLAVRSTADPVGISRLHSTARERQCDPASAKLPLTEVACRRKIIPVPLQWRCNGPAGEPSNARCVLLHPPARASASCTRPMADASAAGGHWRRLPTGRCSRRPKRPRSSPSWPGASLDHPRRTATKKGLRSLGTEAFRDRITSRLDGRGVSAVTWG